MQTKKLKVSENRADMAASEGYPSACCCGAYDNMYFVRTYMYTGPVMCLAMGNIMQL